MSTPTRVMNDWEHHCILIGTIGSILGIIVTIAILIHTVFAFCKQRKSNTYTKPSNESINPSVLYELFYFQWGVILCFLLTLISQCFLRHNLLSGDAFDPFTICRFSYSINYFGITMGHSLLAVSYLYRLYITFRSLPQYAIRQRFNLILVVIFLVIMLSSVIVLVATPKTLVNVEYPGDHDFVFCTNQRADASNLSPWLIGLATQSLFSGYVLYSFVWRLYDIQKELRGSPRSAEVCIEMEIDSENEHKIRQILELNRLMLKMSILVSISILVSWTYVVVGILQYQVSLANSWNITIDVICSYLLFAFTEGIWSKVIKLCYYPCCCFVCCPVIRR